MLGFVFNAVACVLLAAIAVHAVVLHIRLTRFRAALAQVGSVLPSFDASVSQATELASGFTGRLLSELETVEGRLAAARRLGSDLATASRTAEEAAVQLERLLRQHQRHEAIRAAALPREMVEPKGFAERAGLPPAKPGQDKPAAEKTVQEKPVAEKLVPEKPAVEKPLPEKPVAEKQVQEKPARSRRKTAAASQSANTEEENDAAVPEDATA